ncbi:MAG: hypothetical protein DMF72_13105 [Acidobacteria bacterium]|nr:MAG: hypothetical protein DMF72_13105 [Acidobacteriota bacterium]
MKRIAIGLLGVIACGLGIWQAARIGVARTLAQYALVANDRDAAARAVRILPSDAETHATRGLILQHTENYSEAIRELERAVQLRPRDYFPWMILGVTRDLNGDPNGAINALRQSIALAPSYAKAHWQLGNLWLRLGQTDEAFRELRFASSSDATFLPNVIDLAWGVSRNDSARTVAAIQPQTDPARIALALFFAQHKQGSAALDQFHALKSLSGERVHDLVHELLTAKLFPEAYEVWARLHNTTRSTPLLLNGSFEDEVDVGQSGFGWKIPAEPSNTTISIDPSQFQSGAKSLRIDFHGNSKPTDALASQVAIVKAETRYQLTLYSQSKDFISAAAPVISVIDAADEKNIMARSASLVSDSNGWRAISIDLTSGKETKAIIIRLSRQECASDPCAAFGTLWVDSFALSEQRAK